MSRLLLEGLLTRSAARWLGIEVPPLLLRYLTQLIHQESLFFALPFFFVTTAWNSGQALFTGLLGAAALLAITDPLYYKWLAARRWLYLSFHTLALFAVLLVALPLIVHLTTAESYRLALGVALVVALPSLGSSLRIQRWWRWPVLAGLLLALGLGAWLARPWVPPATLWLTQVAVTAELQQRNPGRSLERVEVGQLRARRRGPGLLEQLDRQRQQVAEVGRVGAARVGIGFRYQTRHEQHSTMRKPSCAGRRIAMPMSQPPS